MAGTASRKARASATAYESAHSGCGRWAHGAALLVLVVLTAACHAASAGADAGADAAPWTTEGAEPEPRPGMVWIAGGMLIAGTPPEKIPRVADEEMAGEQVVMHGFYVDLYPYPNEVGAIPTTNMTQAEAAGACEQQGKRLCTELELERACKGPQNTTYEYGDTYRAATCVTGTSRSLVPNGVNAGCVSAFGAHDLHGGIWAWTSSPWKRDPSKPNLFSLRGGNGEAGELIGRCANGRGLRADARREDVGARCCAGSPNTFEVALEVTRGEPLKWQAPDEKLVPALTKLLPDDVQAIGPGDPEIAFRFERMWRWRPLGNEDLLVAGGCAHPDPATRGRRSEKRVCGVIITRRKLDAPQTLGWISSDWWQPTLSEGDVARDLYVHGGDVNGAFRRKVTYAWGRVAFGEKERKKRHKGDREARY